NYLSATAPQATAPQATRPSLILTTAARRPGVILLHYYVTGPKRDLLYDQPIRGRRQAFVVVKNGSEKTVQAISWEISIINWTDKRVLKTIRFNSKVSILPDEAKTLGSEFSNIRDDITYRIQI